MQNHHRWILVSIIVIAAFFRFWGLPGTPPGLYPDEAMNGNNALEVTKTGDFKLFYPENNGREGLFIAIQAMTLDIFDLREPWVLRLPSAVFGTLSVLGLFVLLWEIGKLAGIRQSFEVASIASFFMAISLWHVIFSRIGFRAIAAPFFIIWALAFFLIAFRRREFRAAIIAGAFAGLGTYTYISYRVMPALFLILIPPLWRTRGFNHFVLGAIIAAIIVMLPLAGYFITHQDDFIGRSAQVSIFSAENPIKDLGRNIALTAAMFHIRGDSNWRHNIAGLPQLVWPAGVLLIVGIFQGIRRRSVFDRLMFLWLFLAALPVVISNEGLPHALRAILMIPPIFALVGSGGAPVYEFIRKHLTPAHGTAVVGILAILLVFNAYQLYFVRWGKSPEVAGAFNARYVEIGRELESLPAENPKYIVIRGGGVEVRGIPMPAQTVMFITDTFSPEEQGRKRIYYLKESEYQLIESQVQPYTVFFLD